MKHLRVQVQRSQTKPQGPQRIFCSETGKHPGDREYRDPPRACSGSHAAWTHQATYFRDRQGWGPQSIEARSRQRGCQIQHTRPGHLRASKSQTTRHGGGLATWSSQGQALTRLFISQLEEQAPEPAPTENHWRKPYSSRSPGPWGKTVKALCSSPALPHPTDKGAARARTSSTRGHEAGTKRQRVRTHL